MDLQEEANADVNQMLQDDDPLDAEQMKAQIQTQVQACLGPLQNEIRSLKQQLRSKGTGGDKKNQRSNALPNGRRRNGGSNASNDNSEEKSSNQCNRRKQKQRNRRKGGGNQGGSNNGGRNNNNGRS